MISRDGGTKGANAGAHFYCAASYRIFRNCERAGRRGRFNAFLTVPASDEKSWRPMEPTLQRRVWCLMKTRSDSLTRLLAAFTVVLFAAFMLSPVSARTPTLESAALEGPAGWTPDAEAEEIFADAEFGVDPMVTGPVSDGFRERQARLGCLEAQWPNIPAACYPDFN